jgi:hypothetical protein
LNNKIKTQQSHEQDMSNKVFSLDLRQITGMLFGIVGWVDFV